MRKYRAESRFQGRELLSEIGAVRGCLIMHLGEPYVNNFGSGTDFDVFYSSRAGGWLSKTRTHNPEARVVLVSEDKIYLDDLVKKLPLFKEWERSEE